MNDATTGTVGASGRPGSGVQFVRLPDVPGVVQRAWDREAPFSLVRVGDGELSVLRYPDRVDGPRVQHVFRRAMTDRTYTDAEILDVRAGMLDAVRSADLVGMHDSYEPNDLCVVHAEDLEYAGLTDLTACVPAMHLYLQSCGFLEEFVGRARRVTLVTGRSVLGRLSALWPGVRFDHLPVPVERQYALTEDRTDEHYPDVYRQVLAAIRPEGPDHLYLVGAGLLGKAYCGRAKALGGFALDIGSVFDYWAEVPTRESRRMVEGGRVVASEGSRWPGIWLGSEHDRHALARSQFRGMFRPAEIVPYPR